MMVFISAQQQRMVSGTGTNFSGNSLPGMLVVVKGRSIGFYTPENIPGSGLLSAISQYKNHIAVCFDGYIQIDADATYKFRLWSTDGSKLYIGDELAVNNHFNEHLGNSGEIELKKVITPPEWKFSTTTKRWVP
jgi:hypothetical protein